MTEPTATAAPEPSPAATPALPWHHPTMESLADALGVTTRSLELWRRAGAPIAAAAPHDELAVRLWYRLAGPGRTAGRRGALSAPTLEPLATYDRTAATPPPTPDRDDPKADLNREKVRAEQLRNESREKLHLAQAQAQFAELMRRAERALARLPLQAERLTDLARTGERAAAIPVIAAALRTATRTLLVGVLTTATTPTAAPRRSKADRAHQRRGSRR